MPEYVGVRKLTDCKRLFIITFLYHHCPLTLQAGDINRATEVISNMKALGIPASENIFNSLIVCHGKAG